MAPVFRDLFTAAPRHAPGLLAAVVLLVTVLVLLRIVISLVA